MLPSFQETQGYKVKCKDGSELASYIYTPVLPTQYGHLFLTVWLQQVISCVRKRMTLRLWVQGHPMLNVAYVVSVYRNYDVYRNYMTLCMLLLLRYSTFPFALKPLFRPQILGLLE